MTKVLFVCLGNICRSPMAEAVFRHQVEGKNLSDKITIDSAGTGSWHIGQQPHEGTRTKLDEKGVSFEGQKGRQLDLSDLHEFDYIVAMDASNVSNIGALTDDFEPQIFKLLDFVPGHEGEDVPDPFFTGNFDVVYDMVETGCTNLLQYICEQEGYTYNE